MKSEFSLAKNRPGIYVNAGDGFTCSLQVSSTWKPGEQAELMELLKKTATAFFGDYRTLAGAPKRKRASALPGGAK